MGVTMKEKGVLPSKRSDRVVTISFDELTAGIFREMRDNLGISQSELVREALKFYNKHKQLFDSIDEEILYTYVEMLKAGEHIILDIDHWTLFLNFIESHPEKDKFWKTHRQISRSHAEEFISRNYDIEFIL